MDIRTRMFLHDQENGIGASSWEEKENAQEQYRKHLEERRALMERQKRRLYDNPALFLETEGLYCYDPDGGISSRELYQIYRSWCLEEQLPLATARTFWLQMRKHGPGHALTYCTLVGSNGKRCRGFRGIRALTDNTADTHT